MHFYNKVTSMQNFGVAMMALSADGCEFAGHYVVYGMRHGKLVTGNVVLRRAP